MRRLLELGVLALLVGAALHLAARLPREGSARVLPYLYADTRELVLLVEAAARQLEARGDAAFREFAVPGSRWFREARYVFAYDLEGVCVFHPVTPELVGQNRMDLLDISGKPVIRLVTEIGRRDERDAAGWVFYYWADPAQFSPAWKGSYIRKVVEPSGRVLCVGSGLTDMKVETVFVKERVDEAAALLQAEGREPALARLRDPSSPFQFLGCAVFVMDESGRSLLDPAFPNLQGRDLAGFRDALGHYPLQDALRKLAAQDEAWVQYLRPKPGAITPSRKAIYLKKVTLAGTPLIVGAELYLETPIWMNL